MVAMIFAAGLGTRLAPLTDHKPKALVKFMKKTMLENVAEKLVQSGCDKLVINVHHHAGMMKYFIADHKFGAREVWVSDESDCLLDTGGGMLKAKDLLCQEDNFILYNVDVACDIDIRDLYKHHIESGNLATLAVKDRPSTRNLIFDGDMQLCAWKNHTTGETKVSRPFSENCCKALAFSGISVVSSRIFPLITESGKFSITNLFLRLAACHKIGGYIHEGLWADLGTTEKLQKAKELFTHTSPVSGGC
ncbi:MAG: nucleotidyltransferase family protein [Bacteroidales bacterium]|nr:nucleotidyltransferase family protein [Bacteroidales bacterium]